jgi:hypothetical protein
MSHVMHDQCGAGVLIEKMREQFINMAAVPKHLNGWPLSGSANPRNGCNRRYRPDKSLG